MESVEALIEALIAFEGGVVVVSHDARLIKALDCEIWECGRISNTTCSAGSGSMGASSSSGPGGSAAIGRETGMDTGGLRVVQGGFDKYHKEVLKALDRRAQETERRVAVTAERRKATREARLRRAEHVRQKKSKTNASYG